MLVDHHGVRPALALLLISQIWTQIITSDEGNISFEVGVEKSVIKRNSSNVSWWCYQKAECKQGVTGSGWEEGACKDGIYQSPINLDPYLTLSRGPDDLFESPQHDIRNFTLEIIASKIALTPINSEGFKYNGGISITWNGKYVLFSHVEFHWGPYDDIGSEHTIAGKSASMEMHLVYLKHKFGHKFEEARRSGEKEAIFVVAVRLVADPNMRAESVLSPIVSNLAKLANSIDKGIDVYDTPFRINTSVPVGTAAFSYQGSLTDPPCEEIVRWFILRQPTFIKPSDVEAFRSVITDEDGNYVKLNYRKKQSYYSKVVEMTMAVSGQWG